MLPVKDYFQDVAFCYPKLKSSGSDTLLECRERYTMRRQPAPVDVATLRTWFQNEGFLARDETKYLNHMDRLGKGHDLLSLYKWSRPDMSSFGRRLGRFDARIFMKLQKVPIFYTLSDRFQHLIAVSDLNPDLSRI